MVRSTFNYILLTLLIYLKCSNAIRQVVSEANTTATDIPASLTINKVSTKRECVRECLLKYPMCGRTGFDKNKQLCHLKMYNSNNDVVKTVDEVSEIPFLKHILPKLLVFYNFQWSFDNIFGSQIYPLTPFSVGRNTSGANFLGLITSYLQTNSSGALRDHIFTNKPFSFYARMIRTRRATNLDYVNLIAKFTPCNGDYGGIYFYEDFNGNKVKLDVGKYSLSQFKFYELPVTHSPIGVKTEYSVGASHDGVNAAKFYQNNVVTDGQIDTTNSDSRDATKFECMDIGRWGINGPGDHTHCLSSQLLCFGVANTVLTLEDYQLLDQLCKT